MRGFAAGPPPSLPQVPAPHTEPQNPHTVRTWTRHICLIINEWIHAVSERRADRAAPAEGSRQSRPTPNHPQTRQARPSNDQTVSGGGAAGGLGDIKAKERRERRGGTGETSDSGSQPHCAAVQHLLLYSFANYEGDSWPPRSSPHNAGRMGRDVQPGLLVWGGGEARIFTPSSILICRRTRGGRRQVSQFPWASVYGRSSPLATHITGGFPWCCPSGRTRRQSVG